MKFDDPMMDNNTLFISLRQRAYELAESGRYVRWSKVAGALQTEGFPIPLIQKLDDDKLAVMMITRCCEQARGG